ncbi:MAG: zinc ribbon domain-containing protein [Methanobrevibacter sp.]|nr:zinc ribbon domain-containing protein [Methanobrevibacter sp.]
MVICKNCGVDIGDSKFCPNCGTEVVVEEVSSICPSCGFDAGDSKFCPECGTKISSGENNNIPPIKDSQISKEDSLLDSVIDVDEKISGKFGRALHKSKGMDLVFGKSASIRRNRGMEDKNAKFYAKNEPEFLEVYNSINDDFVKSILVLEREKIGSIGGSAFGAVMNSIYVPTKDMNPNEARQFYRDIVTKIINEINIEKQKGTFDEDKFYKQKVKEVQIDNISMAAPLKAYKVMKK